MCTFKVNITLLRIKVWRTNCFPPAFEFWTTAEVVNNVVKGAKIQISLNVYVQKCGWKQIRNLVPFSISLPTSAEEYQKFKISLPHFEIDNVRRNRSDCKYSLKINSIYIGHHQKCNFSKKLIGWLHWQCREVKSAGGWKVCILQCTLQK